MNAIAIRPLEPEEWVNFRDFRLAALRDMPGMFGSSHEAEAAWTPEQWRETIRGPAHQAFGLFDGGRLIGITAVFPWREDPSGATAVLAMSYILPEYRGRGLSQFLYAARLAWIRANPRYRKVRVSHRASNEASRRANQRHGFVLSGSAPRSWPDGATEDEIAYELAIS